MPIKRNFYMQSAHDLTAKTSEKVVTTLQKERRNRSFASVDEMLSSVGAKRAEVQTAREVRYTLADGVAVFKSMWPALNKQHYPGTVPDIILATRHVPRIKRQLIEPLREGNVTVSDFLTFLFENWSLVRYNRAFKQFRHYPAAPAVDWLLKYSAIYMRLHTDFRMGIPVEDEEVAKPTPETKDDKNKIKRLVQAAETVIKAKDRELAQLRAENKRLQSVKPRRITSNTATNGKAIPKWE